MSVGGILADFGLTEEQASAAVIGNRNVAVTAGAGSGKTRTLVARYLAYLEAGYPPPRVVAITFTEKAAREMRNRARAALSDRVRTTAEADERQCWAGLESQMDAARIGTIHSLCAEILRTHPAEAGVDPQFEVIEEGVAAALQAQASMETLTWAVDRVEMRPIFDLFSTLSLEVILRRMLEIRLDLQNPWGENVDLSAQLLHPLQEFLHSEIVSGFIEEIHTFSPADLTQVAGEKMARQLESLQEDLAAAMTAQEAGESLAAASHLFQARRNHMRLNLGKKVSPLKDILVALRGLYDQHIDPWLGGSSAQDNPPDPELERAYWTAQPLLYRLFQVAQERYQSSLASRRALDFDALEAGAQRLLAMEAVRIYWQAEVDVVLVDEFQDTNARQRAIVNALTGSQPGRLFVVGDARQSIYRFRGADVTVFRDLQAEVHAAGGLVTHLESTFRTHPSLLSTLGLMLKSIMGSEQEPGKPFHVPFTPLRAERTSPLQGVLPPFVEFVLGSGANAAEARPQAARALAMRLLELVTSGEVLRWESIALLFRASSGYQFYEAALEAQGIPFVTVAGRGFYERPEIRDLLNLLQAVADPWDDQAVAGFLRSPAIGLSDVDLYRLRLVDGTPRPFWRTLRDAAYSHLTPAGQKHARRAGRILEVFSPLANRLPVDQLLKRLVDQLDYRAVLAALDPAEKSQVAARLWRNVDKLLADAASSGLVSVRAFLEYLQTLKDVGARHGEAPADVEGRPEGAVRLMTVHRAKGLEFDIVVLADAARRPLVTSEPVLVSGGSGPAFRINHHEGQALHYRMRQVEDREMEAAEAQRLLYVATTRAREKLLISGHLTVNEAGVYRADGWLAELLAAAGISLDKAAANQDTWQRQVLPDGNEVGLKIQATEGSIISPVCQSLPAEWPESSAIPLYTPLPEHIQPVHAEPSKPELEPNGQDLGVKAGTSARLVGQLVHAAIQRWRFPGDGGCQMLLNSLAIEAGLTSAETRLAVVARAEELLSRLQNHPLRTRMEAAFERHHEVPYAILQDGHPSQGVIDLLYRDEVGWQLVDFKTDALHNEADLQKVLPEYFQQLARYTTALRDRISPLVSASLCFLDDRGDVTILSR